MRSLLLRLLRALAEALVGYGRTMALVPSAVPPAHRGPAPGHPERLCPEAPLSAVEAALWQELAGSGAGRGGWTV